MMLRASIEEFTIGGRDRLQMVGGHEDMPCEAYICVWSNHRPARNNAWVLLGYYFGHPSVDFSCAVATITWLGLLTLPGLPGMGVCGSRKYQLISLQKQVWQISAPLPFKIPSPTQRVLEFETDTSACGRRKKPVRVACPTWQVGIERRGVGSSSCKSSRAPIRRDHSPSTELQFFFPRTHARMPFGPQATAPAGR